MRTTTKIVASLTAICVWEIGFADATRAKHSEAPVARKPLEETAVADAALLAGHCKEQTDDPQLTQASTKSQAQRSGSATVHEPVFLKQPLLFAPNGVNLPAKSRNTLNCAVAWLDEHREARILIVGYCDDSGSETCTAVLAERRAEVVRKFLLSVGIEGHQIAGVKAWQNVNQPCRSSATECQRANRSTRLFLTGPTGSSN
jgi:peptidoglycan-associated lipoprotein